MWSAEDCCGDALYRSERQVKEDVDSMIACNAKAFVLVIGREWLYNRA